MVEYTAHNGKNIGSNPIKPKVKLVFLSTLKTNEILI